MKPFDLEKAKAGAKVCTRDGQAVEILKYDFISEDDIGSIIAVATDNDGLQKAYIYHENGSYVLTGESPCDLMMAGEEHSGWIRIYKHAQGGGYYGGAIRSTKEEAEDCNVKEFVCVIEVTWED